MNPRKFLIYIIVLSQALMACSSSPVQRLPSSEIADSPWTTWSEKNTEIGGLKALSEIRTNLLKNNLHDPNISFEANREIDCKKMNTKFRSADGTCYDQQHPLIGASGVAFGRNISPEFIDLKASEKLMNPEPALVAKEFFTRDEFKPVPFLNMLAAVWIQFMNHDWLTHGPNSTDNPYVMRDQNGVEKTIDRTQNAKNPEQFKKEFGKVSINEVTHWWDASQIYGSNQQQQSELREFSRGKMKTVSVNGNTLLPKNESLKIENNRQNQGYEKTGFKDNWWLGLSMLHTLFVREHNAIADSLMKKYVQLDPRTKLWIWNGQNKNILMNAEQLDQEIFQTARLINAAVLAKIHTVEWTPAILPNAVLKKAMHINWYGFINPNTWAPSLAKAPLIGNFLSRTDWLSAVKSGYLIGGIVGDKKNDFGVPYSITEEFTSVYRLHSLLPENLILKKESDLSSIETLPFIESRNEKSYSIMENHATKDLFYSFGTQLPGQLVLNNYPQFMQDLKIPGHGSIDLGMIDIIRDRERGVPRYNQFRRGIGLKPIQSYRDFFPPHQELDERQKNVIKKFEQVYGFDQNGNDNIEMIDLLVGTLAEEVRPQNFGFGETMFQIFILMASRRLMADPYYTDYYNKDHYTQAGLDWIDQQGTLAQVISRHMPELKPHIAGLETAFQPWHP